MKNQIYPMRMEIKNSIEDGIYHISFSNNDAIHGIFSYTPMILIEYMGQIVEKEVIKKYGLDRYLLVAIKEFWCDKDMIRNINMKKLQVNIDKITKFGAYIDSETSISDDKFLCSRAILRHYCEGEHKE